MLKILRNYNTIWCRSKSYAIIQFDAGQNPTNIILFNEGQSPHAIIQYVAGQNPGL